MLVDIIVRLYSVLDDNMYVLFHVRYHYLLSQFPPGSFAHYGTVLTCRRCTPFKPNLSSTPCQFPYASSLAKKITLKNPKLCVTVDERLETNDEILLPLSCITLRPS